MKNREATDTIKGYFYQFDLFILQLLNLQNDNDSVCIEGIEDIDINTVDDTTAIQCKYYAKTEYNHSVIAKPIRLMLKHYSENPKKKLNYKIYGFYSSGQSKLPQIINIDFAKEKFLTYIENRIKHQEHIELKLTDDQIEGFLKHLFIVINALEYCKQEEAIFGEIKKIFKCNDFEAKHFYYSNALHLVKELSTKHITEERTITKTDFISKINTKEPLFNIWFLKKNGIKSYCNSIKSEYFSKINISPYDRFFLIECDETITEIELKTLILKISNNWSKNSKREPTIFCPYVYLHNVNKSKLLSVKNALQSDNIAFIDGFEFEYANFNAMSFCKKPNYSNLLNIKIINKKEHIDDILNKLTNTREIYQFYFSKSFYSNDEHKHIKIPIEETKNIFDII